MWEKLKVLCLNSVTIAIGYIVAVIGTILSFVDALASFYGDENIRAQIVTILGGDPVWTGRVMMVLSICFILARLRSIIKAGRQ